MTQEVKSVLDKVKDYGIGSSREDTEMSIDLRCM